MDLGIIFMIIFVLIAIGAVYYFSFMIPQSSFSSSEESYDDTESNGEPKKNNENLMITIWKSGGIMGMIYRMEIYNDGTYTLFDDGKVKRQGKLNSEEMKSAVYLVKKFPELKASYCDEEGNDMLYHGMKVGNKEVSLGTLGPLIKEILQEKVISEKCLPDGIMDSYLQLDKLMQWEPAENKID